jgi:predicted glycosyltransferase
MLKHVRSFKPEVMVGFGGVSVAHAGWLTQTPSISFYDSENASLQNRITLPFISKMYVPESYSGPTPKGRTVRLKGTKDLSYLHPGAFKPDRDKAIAAGLDPDKDNFFIRIVAWRANHDLGKHGWSDELLQSVITRLSEIGRVHISSEENLPGHLSEFEYKGPKQDVHHVLACCRLMVGESATMACECGLLGTPAIYAGRDFPAYTADMENAGLITNFRNVTEQSLLPEIERWLKVPPSNIIAARDAYARACPDWGLAVVEALDAQRR